MGIPLFDSAFTGPNGVVGKLGEFGAGAPIGFGRVPPSASLAPDFVRARRSDHHTALVAVTGGEAWNLPEGYALLNAEEYTKPFGPPVLQVPSDAWEPLRAAHEAGTTVQVVTHAERSHATAWNVLVEVVGRRPELAPLVIMTPRSGWWQCASERGGGIALWLELLRGFQDAPPERSVHFVASTGHELGHLGLDRYLEARTSLIAKAFAWIHLGASFAAADGAHVRLQASDSELLDLGVGAMRAQGVAPDSVTPAGEPPLGEAGNIRDEGGRYLSLIGLNGRFHSPTDRWPDAVDLIRLAAQSRAFATLVRRLTENPDDGPRLPL